MATSGNGSTGTAGAGAAKTGSSGSSFAGTGASGASGGAAPSALPCAVSQLLAARCEACHGSTPADGAPMSLVTYADLTGPSLLDPAETNAQRALARMQSKAAPMPPLPAAGATQSEIAAMQSWVGAGYPGGGCENAGADAGPSPTAMPEPTADAASTPSTQPVPDATASDIPESGTTGRADASDPNGTTSVCTSGVTATTQRSPLMNAGHACITCHKAQNGPTFAIAGTVYPTAHEPDSCDGVNGSSDGAKVVITDATGKSQTLTVNQVGNFYFAGTIAKPFQAKVMANGRTRSMTTPQTVGDCNSCHTESGANGAPGRIMLP